MRQHDGARAGGDYDAFGADLGVIVDLHGVLIDEFGLPHDAALGGPGFYVFQHEADEAVALGFDAAHYFFAVYADAGFVQMHSEGIGVQGVVAGFCGGNQELGGHAADAGAGGAENVAFDEINVFGVEAGIAKGAHAGGAAADNDNVCGEVFHVCFPYVGRPFR